MKTIEEMDAESTAQIKAFGATIEEEMKDFKVPWFKTIEELTAFIEELRVRPHSYGTCVYAMSQAAVATFNYMASTLGVTGFQASCADLDILRQTRGLKRFKLLNLQDLLYPQYVDKFKTVEELTVENAKWLVEEAKDLMAKSDKASVAPGVWAHWELLASMEAQ